MTAKDSYAQFESLHRGHLVYNDASHDYAGFRNAVREERLHIGSGTLLLHGRRALFFGLLKRLTGP